VPGARDFAPDRTEREIAALRQTVHGQLGLVCGDDDLSHSRRCCDVSVHPDRNFCGLRAYIWVMEQAPYCPPRRTALVWIATAPCVLLAVRFLRAFRSQSTT
jgi:hypothetical protein